MKPTNVLIKPISTKTKFQYTCSKCAGEGKLCWFCNRKGYL
jgi:hypothetical protein